MLGLDNLGAILSDPELRALFKSVATRKVNADLKTLQAHSELSRRLAKDFRGAAGGQSGALRQIVKEHLEYYGTLVDLSHNFHQRLLDTLAQSARGAASEPAINGLTLAVKAPQGSTLRAPFKISNKRAEPIHVFCKASPFVSQDGTQMIASNIAFSPPGAEIAPGAEEIFEAILPIGPDFVPGKLYLATLSAEGFEPMSIVVRLQVEPPAREHAESASPTTQAAAAEVAQSSQSASAGDVQAAKKRQPKPTQRKATRPPTATQEKAMRPPTPKATQRKPKPKPQTARRRGVAK